MTEHSRGNGHVGIRRHTVSVLVPFTVSVCDLGSAQAQGQRLLLSLLLLLLLLLLLWQ